MRRRHLALLTAFALVIAMGSSAEAHPDRMNEDMADGAVETGPHDHGQHGGTGGHLPASSENVELVGMADLTNVPGGISDVGTFGKYAYLGAFSPECAAGGNPTGVHVVDISDPANPTKIGFIPAHPNSYVGEGVQVFHAETPFFNGEILVHNNEPCVSSQPHEGGVSLWNVTNPVAPVKLAGGVGDNTPPKTLANTGTAPINGVSSSHSAFGWWVPGTGKAYVMLVDNQEVADVDILDVTNPAAPVQIGEVGFADWPGAQPPNPLANGDTVFNHDFQVKKIGTKWMALVSYWDAGWVILDVTNPANPTFVNDSDYPTPDPLTGFELPEGNAHQAWWSSNNQFLLGTDEDFSPTRTNCEVTTGPNAGVTPCGEFGFTPNIQEMFPDGFSGTTVWGGSGCNEDVDGNGTSDRDEVLASHTQAQTGADAIVFTRGVCFFSDKIHTGELAGYEMVFVGQSHIGSRNGLLPDGFLCGGQGSAIDGTAAAGCIGHRAMHQLFGDAPEYTGADTADMPAKGTLGESISAVGGVFDGWGYVHLLNANTLQEIDAYAIPEALDPAFQTGFGNLTVHEVQADPRANVNLAYFSYYDAGLRVAKFGKNGIHEVGHYIAEGGNDFWGVEPTQALNPGGRGAPLLLMSDRDSGLWIFRYTGA
ncbi:MAG TPA: hypothetical protein VGS09_03370 [Actinomycetota bacterium]|nr:hypothetical protein [Actinomycetota bacterium]